MANDVRILPTEWVGTFTGASWGIVTEHHAKHDSHGHLDPEWHAIENAMNLRVLQQSGRSLELLWVANGHESKFVGALSSDGRRLVIASREATANLTVNGDSITGEMFTRPHGSARSAASYAAGVVELTAKA